MKWLEYVSRDEDKKNENQVQNREMLHLPKQELNELKINIAKEVWIHAEQLKKNQSLINTLEDQIKNEYSGEVMQVPQIKDLLEKWEFMEAVKVWLNMLWEAVFNSQDSQLFFQYFTSIEETLQAEKIKDKTDAELDFLKQQLDLHIDTAWTTKQRLAYTKALSIIKDELKLRHNPDVNFETKIAEEIEEWSVLLLNKKDAGFGGKLLQSLSRDDVDMTHVIVITQKGPPIRFAHATGQKFSDRSRSGIESDVPLLEYLKQNPSDIVVTTPPVEQRKKAIEKVQLLALEEENLDYSYTDAFFGVIGRRETQSKSFNCGAYVAEVLDIKSQDWNDLAVPNNRLSDRRLKPTYMFTFDPRNQGS